MLPQLLVPALVVLAIAVACLFWWLLTLRSKAKLAKEIDKLRDDWGNLIERT